MIDSSSNAICVSPSLVTFMSQDKDRVGSPGRQGVFGVECVVRWWWFV